MAENTTTTASLVWATGDRPQLLNGQATPQPDGQYRFTAGPGERPNPGERVILCLENAEKTKLRAQAVTCDGDDVVLRTVGEKPQLRRYYPRVDTAVALVYRVIDLGKAEGHYSKRQMAVMKSWWRPATHEVNLSLDGLAFLSEPAIPVGARLSMKLRLPEHPSVDLALTGDVVRVTLEQTAEGEERNRLAVQLTWMSAETHKALIDYIGRWQDDALEELAPQAAPGQP